MSKVLSLTFTHHDHEYASLVRIREKPDRVELWITILDEQPESPLHGDHVFHYKNGQLFVPPADNNDPALESDISGALEKLLQKHPLHHNGL